MSVRTAYGWARSRPRVAAVAAVACLSLTGGVAYAATHSSGPPFQQAVLADAAKRLGVTPAALQNALRQAQIDQVEQAVKDGKLTQAQAKAIIAGIRTHHLMGPSAFPDFGHRHDFGDGPRFGFGRGRGPFGGLFQTAATYLDLTPQSLITQLRGGKTLAQVAADQHKSVSGLEGAIVDAFKAKLDAAVTAHHLTSSQEADILSHVTTFVEDIVTGKFPHFGPGGPGDGDGGMPVPQFKVAPAS
jgi:hypothetical protein